MKTEFTAHDIKSSLKHALSITSGKEKKNRTGSYTLMFSGTMFTLLGSTYLVKYSQCLPLSGRSSLFNRTEYLSVQEAIRKLANSDESDTIPTQVYGKVVFRGWRHLQIVRVEDGSDEPAVTKKTIECHSTNFDDHSNCWKENVSIRKGIV